MSSSAERLRVVKGHLGDGKSGGTREVKKFRFTLDNNVLSEEQREFYEKNGFIVFTNLVAHDSLDMFERRFRDICNGRVDKGRITLMKDLALMKSGAKGEHLYYKIQDFMWDDVLYQYCALPEIVRVVEAFTGPNIMAMHTMLINKPPDEGTGTSRHPLHQDLHYFPFRPADKIVCSWTAMERVNRDNGCLVVLPGTHHGQLFPHDYPEWQNGVNKMYHGVLGFDAHDRVHLCMEKGDTVFFHPLLVHGSGANRTKGFRKAISCHYAASECNYIDIAGTTQENIAKEVEEIAKKRGTPVTFLDVWHMRNRLVIGTTVNL